MQPFVETLPRQFGVIQIGQECRVALISSMECTRHTLVQDLRTFPPFAFLFGLLAKGGMITHEAEFETYLLWQSPRRGSIGAPVRRVDWQWSFTASAQLSDGNYEWAPPIHLWNAKTGRHRADFVGPSTSLAGMAMTAGGRQLLAGFRRGKVFFWNLDGHLSQVREFEKQLSVQGN